jgi:hypothetical protein
MMSQIVKKHEGQRGRTPIKESPPVHIARRPRNWQLDPPIRRPLLVIVCSDRAMDG